MKLRRLLVLPVLLFSGGCCFFEGACPPGGLQPMLLAVLESSSGSSTQTGLGAAVAVPAAATGAADYYLHAGYMRQFWDGGADNIFSVGGQARRPLDRSAAAGTWIGLEGTYHYWSVSPDDYESPGGESYGNPVSNTLGVSGLIGHPLGESGVSLFGSAGLLYFSDFKRDGSVWDEGGVGWMVRTGVAFTGLFGGN